jgi:GNAT superfamily N-acetyltransferase
MSEAPGRLPITASSRAGAAVIAPMQASDLAAADRILRLSFGTELGLPDPMQFRGDSGLVLNRFQMYPEASFVARVDGAVAGFGIASRWGRVGLIGPVCVDPAFWNRGLARALLSHIVEVIDRWGCTASGLFTNPLSPRHLRLYQSFGFWPRGLTVVLARPVDNMPRATLPWRRYRGRMAQRELPERALPERTRWLEEATRFTQTACQGLDLTREIAGVIDYGHGEVVALHEEGFMTGLAICHVGASSEGGSRNVFVKYGQVAADERSSTRLADLVHVTAEIARDHGAERVVLGMVTSRHEAYRKLIEMGFRSEFQGVRMHRPWAELEDGAGQWIIDDWR